MMGSELALCSLLILRAGAGISPSSSGCFRLRIVLSDTTTGTSEEGSCLMVMTGSLDIPGCKEGSSSTPSLSSSVSSTALVGRDLALLGGGGGSWSPVFSRRCSFFSSFLTLASSDWAYFVQLSRDSRNCLPARCISSYMFSRAAYRMASFVYIFSQFGCFPRSHNEGSALEAPILPLVESSASAGRAVEIGCSVGIEGEDAGASAACVLRSWSSSWARARF